MHTNEHFTRQAFTDDQMLRFKLSHRKLGEIQGHRADRDFELVTTDIVDIDKRKEQATEGPQQQLYRSRYGDEPVPSPKTALHL